MSRNPPNDLGIVPDTAARAANTATIVRNAYSTAMTFRRNDRQAFETAVRAWQERNPDDTLEEARRAVAAIICGKL